MGWLLAIVMLGVGSRLLFLHTSAKDFLRKQGDARTLRTISIPSYRGLIMDRRGTPLAVSTPMDSVWINPKLFQPTKKQLLDLSRILSVAPDYLVKKTRQNKTKSFIYIKRGIHPDLSDRLTELNIKGLNIQREFRRFYPSGESAAQLVGFTNIDDQGQSGLELSYNSVLKPIDGKKKVLEDQLGHWVKDIDNIQVPRSGEDLFLSIDLRIQSLALRELTKALKKYGAKSGTLVMLDIKTGEILAMISAPSFNPNNLNERQGSKVRNRALTDQFEPGSTVKTFSLLSALEGGQFSPSTIIDTNPGYYKVGSNLIHEPNNKNFGKITFEEVLIKSSNVGTSKITWSLPPANLLSTFKKLGLGVDICTEFPGEAAGRFPDLPKSPFTHATIAFGYGLSVTPIQLINAYATIARGGKKLPVTLLRRPLESPENPLPMPETVISSLVAKTTIEMLSKSGAQAHIHGFNTAGKTGTTRVIGAQGYDASRHMALFAGFTPVNNPRLATLIIIEEPSEQYYYGSQVAVPVYTNVVGKALHMLNVTPDKV
jgi:cell division protein FtsI (penicillin-binding protein 3)